MKDYSPEEERLNIYSHALGFILSIVAAVFLLIKSFEDFSFWSTISVLIYSLSMLVLYAASTLYHSAKEKTKRLRLKVFDHAAIYVLIAGTYTPFSLITLKGEVGWIIFGVIWGLAAIGITFKLFFTGRFKIVSTIMYVLMGWVIIFAINPLIENLSTAGLYWLFGGGVAYTLGAILYSIKKIKFNHAIFHVCVLIGSFCHFYAVLNHVL
ncbi:hemolysin D [Brumimicrobium salinarum]|uniref:Hemolysin D n=1 Tax=Brumimicrobium salinarum TaxID=2058658 RepID=A0A2I0R0Q3_9FLAO|nr:hemolysin III family protein [Brumimicrobium salinarum]PKR80149.1 hemolysin D [Brumimicrobium salinarum]